MAPPKFPLKMQDGAQVRNMEELREHADLWTLEQSFQDGRLVRWLKVWHYAELAEAVQRLDGETSDLHIRLCAVLGIPYLESMETEYRATAAEAKLVVEPKVATEEEIAEDVPDMSARITGARITVDPLDGHKTIHVSFLDAIYDSVSVFKAFGMSKETFTGKDSKEPISNVSKDSKEPDMMTGNPAKEDTPNMST